MHCKCNQLNWLSLLCATPAESQRQPALPACLPTDKHILSHMSTYLITEPMLLACSGDSLCHSERTFDSSRLAQKKVTSGRSAGSSSCRHASQAAGVWEKALSQALA